MVGKSNGAAIIDPQYKRLRALLMIEQRVKYSKSYTQIAEMFQVDRLTVSRNLTWAKKAGLVVGLEDKILQDLGPLAYDALKYALKKEDPDPELAMRILENILPDFGKKSAKPTISTNGDNDLEAYIASLRDGTGTIDGVIAQRALPERTEGHGSPTEAIVTEERIPEAIRSDGNKGDVFPK